MLQWTLGYTCLFQFWFPQCVCPAVGIKIFKTYYLRAYLLTSDPSLKTLTVFLLLLESTSFLWSGSFLHLRSHCYIIFPLATPEGQCSNLSQSLTFAKLYAPQNLHSSLGFICVPTVPGAFSWVSLALFLNTPHLMIISSTPRPHIKNPSLKREVLRSKIKLLSI